MLSKNPALMFLGLTILAMSFMAPEAYAFDPSTIDILPESRDGESTLANIIWTLLLGGLILIAVVIIFGLGDLVTGIFASLQEARKTDEWRPFIRTLVISAVIIVVTFFIASLVVSLISNANFNPSVNVG